MLYYIDTHYACFGIIEEGSKVVMAAPIAKWTIGKSIVEVINYYKIKKKAKVITCS